MPEKLIVPPICKCGETKIRVPAKMRNKTYLRWRCNECQKKRQRASVAKNRLEYNRRHANRAQLRHRLHMQKVVDYLRKNLCMDCGETDWMVLQFDHVRDQKTFMISYGLSHRTWEAIEAEIAKCDVRCANCHIRKTIERSGWLKYVV